MDKVSIYWDDSNIFISAQQVAIEREGEVVSSRMCIHFRNLLELTRAGREIEHAAIPSELRHMWNRLENEGVTVHLLERGAMQGREQGWTKFCTPRCCAMDSITTDAVLLTGDGAGFDDGVGFHADLERMRRRDWRIEVVSWRHSCNRWMREWAEENGQFIALDDFYDSVTFLERPALGEPIAAPRYAVSVDLNRRR